MSSGSATSKPEPSGPTRRVLVMGLPGAGKSTLARALARRLNAVHFDADQVRAHINRDLGFSIPDRIEHARRMGWLCDRVIETGNYAIADFICPLPETRAAFGPAFTVWVDRIAAGRFADTNALFIPPERYDVRVTAEGSPEGWAELIAGLLHPVFDPKAPTALFLGRYQPFHEGHRALVIEGIDRVGQACIAVRDTGGSDAANPFSFEQIRPRIEAALAGYRGRFIVIAVPNITNIFHGGDVGYQIERIDLDPALQTVSATKIGALLADVPTG